MAASNNALAHYEQSHGYDQYRMYDPIFMGCKGAAVISLMLYPNTDRFSHKWPEYETKSAYEYQVLDFIW